MIQVPVTGEYDSDTKSKIFRAAGGTQLPDKYLTPEWGVIKMIWPSSSTYEIVHGSFSTMVPTPAGLVRGFSRYGDPWYMPIDLGDNIKLTPIEFHELMIVQFPNANGVYDVEEVVKYLKRLLNEDVQVYKLIRKMEDNA